MPLDSYGAVRQVRGHPQDCPFHYQGQYEDVKTGFFLTQMQQEEIIAALVALVEGNIAPAAWISWWNDNAIQLQGLLPRTAFLKMKPNVSFGNTRAALVSQTGALEYLNKNGIAVVRADKYATTWQNEEAERASRSADADELAKSYFAADFIQLKQNFPNLYECLKKHLPNVDAIASGKSANAISAKEATLQYVFSASQRLFMRSVSRLQLDGVKYDFDDIRWLKIASTKYLVWGEYWLEGDGDLLLSDPTSNSMLYLGHSSKSAKPQLLNTDFYKFIERDLVGFILENE